MRAFNTLISNLFGTTRNSLWADTQLVNKVACDTSGVIIAASDGQPLIDASMNAVAVLGPSGSGKTTTIVVPTLLTWRESAIVADMHGELYGITAHWRRTGAHNEVRRLSFGDPTSPDTFNFLAAIPRGKPGELADIHDLVAALLGDGPAGGYWRHHTQSLLTLLIIAGRSSLIGSMYDVQQAVNDNAAFDATIATYCGLSPDNDLGQAAKAAATHYAGLAESARVAVREVVANSVAIFASPEVARNTMRSSFDLAELRNGRTAMTLYLTFAAHDLGRLQPLIRAFLAQVVRHGTQENQQAAAHRLLLVLDPFAALGRLPFLENSLGYLRGYGIKALLSIQNLTQVNRAYGKENSVWRQCDIRTVLPVNDLETAVAVAEDIQHVMARPGQVGAVERQPSITPDELMRMGKREALILGAASRPIRATTLPYYDDVGLKARAAAANAAPLMID